jgi:hypothetical protein
VPEKGPCGPERWKMRFLRREIAAMHESGSGPSRHFAAMRNLIATGGIADSRESSAIYGFTA